MASPDATEGGGEAEETLVEVNASREVNLGVPEEFPVDPVSSEVADAKEAQELKEAAEAAEAAKKAAKCEIGQTLMSALVVSGVVVAAIGVAFFVTKRLRET